MANNLAEGKPPKLLSLFVIPMVVGNLLQQLYNIVGSTVVGRFVGEDALAVVGSSFSVIFLSVVIVAGMSMGCTVVISQFSGADKTLEMKITVSVALILPGVIGPAVMEVGEIIAGPLLILLGTDPDTTVDSLAYLRIYFGGAVFLFLYNSLNGVYNALGDNQAPLKLLMVSALTNIVLDLLFVIQFSMGVAGMAWAALIVQRVYVVFFFLVLVVRLRKLEDEGVSRGKASTFFDRSLAGRIVKVGMPSTLQQSAISISMVLMQGLANFYREVPVAGCTAATKIDTLATILNMNFFNAMSSYVAQNIGARKMDRVKQGYKASMSMVVVFSPIITSIIFLFGPRLLGLLLKRGSEGSVISYGLSYMKIVSVFYILMGVLSASNGLLRGAGGMGVFMPSSVVSLSSQVVIIHLPACFIDSSAIWWSIPTGWTIGVLFSFLRVRSGKWMVRRLVD